MHQNLALNKFLYSNIDFSFMEPEYVCFETYGCVANQNSTEIMKAIVTQAGLEVTNNLQIADIIVINTCIVKQVIW